MQTQIRLLLKEQSDQGLHCLPFHLYNSDCVTDSSMSRTFTVIILRSPNILNVYSLSYKDIITGGVCFLFPISQCGYYIYLYSTKKRTKSFFTRFKLGHSIKVTRITTFVW